MSIHEKRNLEILEEIEIKQFDVMKKMYPNYKN